MISMETGFYCFAGCVTGLLVAWGPVIKPLIRKKIISIVEKKGKDKLGGCAVTLKGVNFQIGSKLHVEVENLVVANPEGWKSQSLLTVGHVIVQVDYCAAIISAVKALGKPKEVTVNHLDLNVLHLTWENSLTISNIKDMQDRMKAAKKKEEGGDDDVSYLSAAQEHATRAADVGAHAAAFKKEKKKGMKILVRKLSVKGVKAEIIPYQMTSGVALSAGDIIYDDFSAKNDYPDVNKLIEILVNTLIASVKDNAASMAENPLATLGAAAESTAGLIASVKDNAASIAVNPSATLSDAAETTTGSVAAGASYIGSTVSSLGVPRLR